MQDLITQAIVILVNNHHHHYDYDNDIMSMGDTTNNKTDKLSS